MRQLCWGRGQPNGTQGPALGIAFLFPGLGQGALMGVSAVSFQVPTLLGFLLLTLTSHLSVCFLSSGRALPSRKAEQGQALPMDPSHDILKAPVGLLS